MHNEYSRPHLRLWQLGYLLTASAIVAASCADDFRAPAALPMNRLVGGLIAYAVGAGGMLFGHALLVFMSRRSLGRVIERAMLVSEAEQTWHSFIAFLLSPVWAGLALHHALEDPTEMMQVITLPMIANCLAAGAFAVLPWLLRLHREVRICKQGLLIGTAPLAWKRISHCHRVSSTLANFEIQRGGTILLVCRTAAGCDWLVERVA